MSSLTNCGLVSVCSGRDQGGLARAISVNCSRMSTAEWSDHVHVHPKRLIASKSRVPGFTWVTDFTLGREPLRNSMRDTYIRSMRRRVRAVPFSGVDRVYSWLVGLRHLKVSHVAPKWPSV